MMWFLFVGVLGLLVLLALGPGRRSAFPDLDESPGVQPARRLPLLPLGWALSLFLVVTYLLCVAFDLIFPAYAMYGSWAALLPGFVWLTPISFVIGLVESFLYGWYAALVFGAFYNVSVTWGAE